MAGKKIFISYRRQDAGGEAGRLADNLQEVFQHDRIFMDVDTIEPGADFVEVINNAVSSCDVMLVMIGPHWINMKDSTGKRRLDNPDDFVRLEIAAALKRNIRVIPVLVNGAIMPSADQLPDELDALTRRHAHELSSSRWKFDSEQLIILLEKLLGIERKEKEEEKKPQTIFVPKPPQKSWWSKNYLWIIGVVVVIIILLSLPEEEYLPDDSYYPDSENVINGNLTGTWSGINDLGQNYSFKITQNGNNLNFEEYNHLGYMSASGSGIVYDRDIELQYNSILDVTADVELTLSADGRKLDGFMYLPNNITVPISLAKN